MDINMADDDKRRIEEEIDWGKIGKINCYIPKGFVPPYLIEIAEPRTEEATTLDGENDD
jgi:hypothetical protein